MNDELDRRGEPSGLNERKLGGVLTLLSLTNRNRTNARNVLWLDRAARIRIHEAARDYGIERNLLSIVERYNVGKCKICMLTNRPVPAIAPLPKPAPVETQMRAKKTADSEGRERRARQSPSLRFRAGLESD